jgi:hypothetical protein
MTSKKHHYDEMTVAAFVGKIASLVARAIQPSPSDTPLVCVWAIEDYELVAMTVFQEPYLQNGEVVTCGLEVNMLELIGALGIRRLSEVDYFSGTVTTCLQWYADDVEHDVLLSIADNAHLRPIWIRENGTCRQTHLPEEGEHRFAIKTEET